MIRKNIYNYDDNRDINGYEKESSSSDQTFLNEREQQEEIIRASDSSHSIPLPLLIFGSILGSVSLITINKILFTYGFEFVFTLTSLHFITTSAVLQFSARVMKYFQIQYLPFGMNLLFASFGVISICLMNISLRYNSIGFYQISKLCIVPCCLVINILKYGEWPSRKIFASLCILLLGVGIATVTDFQLNLKGFLFGVAAVVATAQYQIWQGKKQEETGFSSMQLANSIAILQVFVCSAFAVVIERNSLTYFMSNPSEFSSTQFIVITLILISCFNAALINVIAFLLIGRTSAVTFQVVGHGKTCLILISGYYIFLYNGGLFSDLYINLLGVILALFGVILYGNVKANDGDKDIFDKVLPQSLLSVFSHDETTTQQVYSELDITDEDTGLKEKTVVCEKI